MKRLNTCDTLIFPVECNVVCYSDSFCFTFVLFFFLLYFVCNPAFFCFAINIMFVNQQYINPWEHAHVSTSSFTYSQHV